MQTFIKVIMLVASCLMFVACSDDSNSGADAKKDHVWKEQTDSIDKAKEVEGMILESQNKMKEELEEQTR